MSGNPCAIPGCQAGAKPGQLMCKPHWFSVSPKGRRDVNHTWAAYRGKRTIQALGEYREARDAAIAEIVEKQKPDNQPELF